MIVEFWLFSENRVLARVEMPTVPLENEMVKLADGLLYKVRGRGWDVDPGSLAGSDGDRVSSASAWVSLVPWRSSLDD